jgi:hypothetical protein
VSQRRIISMLEFLRTGNLGGIHCGSTTEDVLREFGQPWYKAKSLFVKNVSWFRYDSLELWFHEEQQIISRMTLQRFKPWRKRGFRKKTHFFDQSVPSIPRAIVDPWVIREGLEVNTLMRFLKSADFEYAHSQWRFMHVDQINLTSGVVLLCDPLDSDDPGLGYIDLTDAVLHKMIEEEAAIER